MPKAKIKTASTEAELSKITVKDATDVPEPDLPDTQIEADDNQAIVNDNYDYDLTNTESASSSVKSKKISRHYVAELVLFVIVVVLALFVWSLNSDKNNLNKEVASLNANPQAIVQKQAQSIISAVGQLMQLPAGQPSNILTVSNVAAAKKQAAFFDNAQIGDRVLLYDKAGEAILYRPSTNKIILVAPLNISGSTTGTTSGSGTSN